MELLPTFVNRFIILYNPVRYSTHDRRCTSIPSWRPALVGQRVHTCRRLSIDTVDIVIANEHADGLPRNYLSVSAGKRLTDRKNRAPAPRVQIGGASRSILSNVSLPLCNTCARAKPLVRAIRVPGSHRSSEARCNGNVAAWRGKERDVSLWDNPPLLGVGLRVARA